MIQVKLSRDYKPLQARDEFERNTIASGWLTFKREKLKNFQADLWVVVIVSYERKSQPQHLVIPPHELLKRLDAIHGQSKSYHFYPVVTKNGLCLDARGLPRSEKKRVQECNAEPGARDLSKFLEDRSALKRLSADKDSYVTLKRLKKPVRKC